MSLDVYSKVAPLSDCLQTRELESDRNDTVLSDKEFALKKLRPENRHVH